MLKPIHFRPSGVLTPKEFGKFKKKFTKTIKYTMAESFRVAANQTKVKLGSDIQSVFNVKRPSFAKAIRKTVYNSKPGRMPLLEMHNAIWWFSAHERGKKISNRRRQYMLLPIQNIKGSSRIKPMRWLEKIEQLRRSGDTFIRKVKGGRLILFATLTKENRGKLREFSKIYRQKSGDKKVSYGSFFPIGILVKNVKMRKRLDFAKRAEYHFMPLADRHFNNNISFKNLK